MDSNTGKLYKTPLEALQDGVELKNIIKVEGNPKSVKKVSKAVKKQYKRDKGLNTPEFNRKWKKRREKDKAAKTSRKKNRRK